MAVASAATVSARYAGNTEGMNRPRDFSSNTLYAIWSGCPAIRRPQIAYRFGQMSSPSS